MSSSRYKKYLRILLLMTGLVCAVFLLLYLLVGEYRATALNKQSNDRKTALPLGEQLVKAAEKGDYLLVRYLLNKQVNINYRNPAGKSALHAAAENGCKESLKILLKAGADTSLTDKLNNAPLFYAARNGHAGSIKILLDYKADISHGSFSGNTALHAASFAGHRNAVLLLLKNKAPLWAGSSEGKGVLAGTLQKKQFNTALILLQAGADPNECDLQGNSAFMLAAAAGRSELLQMMLNRGTVNKYHTNKDGKTALDLAKENNHAEVVVLLKKTQ